MFIEGDYSLRPTEGKDLEVVLKWRNTEHIRANMYSDHFITMDEHKTYMNKVMNSSNHSFNIFEYQGKPLGIVHYYNIDVINNMAKWGFYIGEQNQPKGTGLIMGYLGLTFGFETLLLRKIVGEAFGFNKASVNYHKKLGFVEEGKYSKHVLKNGKYEDIFSFAIFEHNWLANKARLKDLIGF